MVKHDIVRQITEKKMEIEKKNQFLTFVSLRENGTIFVREMTYRITLLNTPQEADYSYFRHTRDAATKEAAGKKTDRMSFSEVRVRYN